MMVQWNQAVAGPPGLLILSNREKATRNAQIDITRFLVLEKCF